MRTFRRKLFAALLFGLLSLGQAYPFSAAWAMSGKSHPCCCSSQIAKPCDCDHKGHSSSKKKTKKFSCHEENAPDGAHYAPAPCGAKTEAISLNFRGETCLPRFAAFVTIEAESWNPGALSVRLPNVLSIPESPPPRQG